MGKRSNHKTKRLALSFAWKHEMKVQVVGLAVDGKHVYAGDDNGNVVALWKGTGAVAQHLKVPKAVRCIAHDAAAGMVLAGCNDGNIYDVTVPTTTTTAAQQRPAKVRRSLAPLMGVDWIEVNAGRLYASDHEGGLTAFDVEGNVMWEKRDEAAGEGWMVRAGDDGAVYHGCSDGLRAYASDGAPRWRLGPDDGVDDVRFGALVGDSLFVTAGWMKRGATWLLAASTAGALRWKRALACDDAGFKMTGAEALAAVAGERGHGVRVYVSAGTWVFCYDGGGKKIWEAPTGCGTCCNMVVEERRMFVVTTTGTVAALELPRA